MIRKLTIACDVLWVVLGSLFLAVFAPEVAAILAITFLGAAAVALFRAVVLNKY